MRVDASFDLEPDAAEEVGDPELAPAEPEAVELAETAPVSVGVAEVAGYVAPRALISKGCDVA